MEIKSNNVTIKHLKRNDLLIARQLFLLFNQMFEIENTETVKRGYLEKLLENEYFVCLAASYNDEIIGGLTAYILPLYNSEVPEIFIYDIAVKLQFQRIGVGMKLLSAIKEYAAENEIKVVFVNACESDLHALDFYRSAKGEEEKAVQFTFNF